MITYTSELTKFEVTFAVRKEDGSIDHKWSATWYARDFGHAELLAREQLAINKDSTSKIEGIELW